MRHALRQAAAMLHAVSPVIAITLLLGLPLLVQHEMADLAQVEARHERVVAAANAVPYRIGDWIGEDIPVPEAAVDILQPNALLSRRYRRPGGEHAVDLLIVHCSDTRDMLGHFPPICYPAHGWLPADDVDAAEAEAVSATLLEAAGKPVTARLYRFRRLHDWGDAERLRVLNYFVLPDGTTTADLERLDDLAGRLAISVQGVAQVQVVTTAAIDDRQFIAAAEHLLAGARQFLFVLERSNAS